MLNSLRFRLLLIFLGLAVSPLVLVGVIVGQRGFASLEQQSLALQREVAAHVGGEIRAFVEERKNELVFLDRVYGLVTLDFEKQREILSSVLQYRHAYHEVAMLDSEGQEQIRLSRLGVISDGDLRSRAGNEEFLFPTMRGETYFGPVRFDETIGEPLITISIPLFDRRSGEIVNVLVADLRFRAIWNLLAEAELSTKGEVYVTDQAGQVIAHRDPTIVLRGTTVYLPEADGRATGLSGTDVIIARDFLRFGDQELVVVAEQPATDALELATNSLRVTMTVTSAVLVLAVVLVVLTTRRVVRPIEALAASARAISSDDFSRQIKVSSRTEIGQLASAFNQMVSDLAESRKRIEQYTRELESANEQLQRDIAERKRVEEALRYAKAAAEEANRAKSVFLANMSHELRTPLNSILGFSELLMRAPNLTANQRKNLEIVGHSGEHLLTLINDVLELSKIEAGRVELQQEEFDLHCTLLDLEEMFRLRAEQKGLFLVCERAPDVPQYVRADKYKLRQVLVNLLSNAVKFTHQGGITLRSSVDQNLQLADLQARKLYFEVEDTGVGIAPDEMDAVFDAFTQTPSGQQSHQGTGLGIPISHEFVRAMGGELTVDSEVGKGSTFKFDLQIEIVDAFRVQAAPSARRAVGLELGQPVYRLLVAEDVEMNRELLVQFLQSFVDPADNRGFEIREAVNGQEAIEIWEEWKPHLIWMDMRMPVMDGHKATQYIKSKMEKGKAETIVIALTASAFEEDRAAALAGGCDDFVRKPFRGSDIVGVLTRHLGVRFVYEETGESISQQTSELVTDLSLTLAGTPGKWLANLHQAALEGDLEWEVALVKQIQDMYPTLADKLMVLVNNFAHDKILSLIRQVVENEQVET